PSQSTLHHHLLTTCLPHSTVFFFFTDTPTPEIYTLSLHDALPISGRERLHRPRPQAGDGRSLLRSDRQACAGRRGRGPQRPPRRDRKSTRLNSSHVAISYAVFCLKKKKKDRVA